MLKKLILSSFLGAGMLVCTSAIGQADVHFSQFKASPLNLNPANAGLFNGKLRVATNYRRQWESVSELYQTIGASADFLVASDVFASDFFGLGVQVFSDQAGTSGYNQFSASMNGSYTKILNSYENHYLTLGAQVGFGQRAVEVGDLVWDNQWVGIGFDPSLPSNEVYADEAMTFVDFGAGVNYFYSSTDEALKVDFGIAAFHLNRPDISFLGRQEKLYAKYVANGGLNYFIDRQGISFYPNFMYIAQGPHRLLNYGVDVKILLSDATRVTGYVKETSLALGVYHRWDDAVYPVVKLNAGGFSLGISYDMHVSELGRASNGTGGPEFALGYRAGFKSGARSQPRNQKFY